jgi:branched-chain amino acid transport system ATP-binding protein
VPGKVARCAPRRAQFERVFIGRVDGLGITVLLVEKNGRQTLAIAHYGDVLSQGRVVAEGACEALAGNDAVRAAYFG